MSTGALARIKALVTERSNQNPVRRVEPGTADELVWEILSILASEGEAMTSTRIQRGEDMNKDKQHEVDREVGLFICRRMKMDRLTIGDIPDSMSGEAARTLAQLAKLPDNIENHVLIGRAIRGGLHFSQLKAEEE